MKLLWGRGRKGKRMNTGDWGAFFSQINQRKGELYDMGAQKKTRGKRIKGID